LLLFFTFTTFKQPQKAESVIKDMKKGNIKTSVKVGNYKVFFDYK